MGKAYAFSNLIPVFTAIFAYLFLSEALHWHNILGVLLVVGGLFCINRQKSEKPAVEVVSQVP
jgi:drug/metabolite transporter (DMT)-like permease